MPVNLCKRSCDINLKKSNIDFTARRSGISTIEQCVSHDSILMSSASQNDVANEWNISAGHAVSINLQTVSHLFLSELKTTTMRNKLKTVQETSDVFILCSYLDTLQILYIKPTWCTIFLSVFTNLYMFRTTMCPSSGETTVFMRHLVLWMTVWYAEWNAFHPAYQTVFHTE
jgi:hypothetical protein